MGTQIMNCTSTASTFTLSSGAGIITANTNVNGALTTSGTNGSIQVASTRIYNTGANYTFNGATAQFAGSGFTGANNLSISNSAGVTLSAPAAVTGTLALNSGKLTLGANNLTLTGATVTGASSSNYIVTNSTGRVLRSIASGGGSFLFPIGRSSNYNALTITNTGGTTAVYTVGADNTTYTPAADGAAAQWSIAASASTTSSLAFQWLTANAGANLSASPASGKAYQYNGSSWDDRGGSTATGTPNTTTVTGITNLTNPTWTVAMPPVAPDIALADNSGGQVAGGNITRNSTNNIIYNFQTAVTSANATLSSVSFTTNGSYSATDVSNFKLWYSTSNSFGSASQIGSSITTGLGTGSKTFSSLAQAINNGTTGYFWITTDVPAGATPGATLDVSAISTSDLTFGFGNKTGSTSAGGSQKIVDAPTVTTGSASSVTTTTATLNGTVSANALSSTAAFNYGTTISYGSSVTAAESPVTTQSAAITGALTGLTANTLYHFRATATNAVNTTNGSDASFTTVSLAPVMDDVTARNPTSTSFTANWSAPGAQGSESYTYTIEVDNDNAFGSVDYTQSGISSGTFSENVTGLSSATTYYYRVKAVNAAGSSDWSATSAGVTTSSATAPTVVVGTVTGSGIVTGGAEVATNEVTTDGGDAVIDRGLRYNTSSPADGAGGTNVSHGSNGTGTYTQTLSGLSANTLYYVKAYATNGVGTAYSAGEVSFTTLATEPTTAATVSFGTRTDVSLVLNFSGGDGGRRVVLLKQGSAVDATPADRTTYTANAAFGSGDQLGTGNWVVYDGTGASVTVTGLTKNTTYHVAVFEYNNNSAGSPNYYTTAGTGSAATYNPTVTVTGSLSAFGNVANGQHSASQSYSVSGTELVSSITVTAPAGFAISLDDVDYSTNPLVLTRNGSDEVLSTTVYVRFSPSSASGATGTLNVTNAATEATTQNVAVSGNAIDTEPTTEGAISFGTVTGTSIVVNLPATGNGDARIIVVKAGSAVDANPADGSSYTANALFGSGSQLGTGNYVVYNGTASGSNVVTVTGLSGNTTYHFAVFEYNEGTGTSQNYLTPSTVTGNATTPITTSATDQFRSAASGNWGDLATWQSFSGGTWIAATQTPTSSAAAINVLNTHTVTIPASTSITADELTVDAGGQITIAATGTLVVNNGTGTDLTVNGYLLNSGTLTTTGATVSVSGSTATYEHALNNLTIPANITWASSSTLRLSGAFTGTGTGANLGALSAGSYQNVIWAGSVNFSGGSTVDFITIGDNAITIAGKLTASGTGNGAFLTSAAGTSPTVAEYEQTSGIVYINRNSGSTRSLTVTGNATISGGTLHIKNLAGAGAGQLIVGGNLNVGASATLTNSGTAGSAALQFNGSSAQTWSNAGAFSNAIAVSTITNAGGVTLNTNLTLPSTSSITLTAANFTVASGSTLTFGTSATAVIGTGRTLTVEGTLVRTANSTFTTTGTLSIASGGRYQHAFSAGTVPTATWSTGSICEITGATAPTAGLGQSFHHFYWNSAAQSATINLVSSLTTVNGNFEVQNTNGNILRLSSSTLTLNVGGNFVISGTNSTVQASSSGNTATINVTGDFIIGSTATMSTAGNAYTINVGGDWNNSGTFTNTNSTVVLNGTVDQDIIDASGEVFRALTINKSSGTAVMNNNVTVSNTLTLTSGNLSIGSNTLTLNGAVSRTAGNLAGGNSSNLSIGGAAGSLFFASGGTSNFLRSLSIGASGSATLGNALNITAYDGSAEGVVTVTSGGTLTSAGFLTLKSSANGSARVAQGSTAGGYITGDVTVERFIPQNSSKSWRLLASNTSGQTINQAWQEGGVGPLSNPNPGFGTQIFGGFAIYGTASAAQAAGYDSVSQRPSLYRYDAATDNLVAVGATTSTSLSSEQGYFIFIRGDRSPYQFGIGAPTTSTVLRSKGTLFTGDQTAVSTGAQNWGLVRNPYPSRIDMRQIVRGGSLIDAFQVWDPKLGGSFGVGGYQTFSKNSSSGNYEVSPGGGSYGANGSEHNYIESGHAFFIQSSGGTGTAQVVEAAKVSGSEVSFRPSQPQGLNQRVLFNLYASNGGANDGVDGGYADFDELFSNGVDNYDVRKSPNFNENFGLTRNNTSLAVERRRRINLDDTLFFEMGSMRQIAYRLDLRAENIDPVITSAYLEDQFTGSRTPVSLAGDVTAYTFNVTSAAASRAANRFRLVFRQSGVVPVSIVSVKAVQLNRDIRVDWQVASQVNVARYEVEHSVDGRQFSKLGEEAAANTSRYSWLHAGVSAGTHFYRIRAVDQSGAARYSSVVKVLVGSGKTGITVSPNPVNGNFLNLQFSNLEAGKYAVRLINLSGQTVYKRELQHAGGSASESFVLPSGILSGQYQLEVIKPGQDRELQTVLIQSGN